MSNVNFSIIVFLMGLFMETSFWKRLCQLIGHTSVSRFIEVQKSGWPISTPITLVFCHANTAVFAISPHPEHVNSDSFFFRKDPLLSGYTSI